MQKSIQTQKTKGKLSTISKEDYAQIQKAKVDTELKNLVDFFSKNHTSLPRYVAETFLKHKNIPSDKWSLNNKLIASVHDSNIDARTYLQWQEAKRNVKKGEKAFYILAPNKFVIEKENKETKKIEKKAVMAGFKAIAVFSAKQTEGEQEISYVVEPKNVPPLMDVAKKMGLKVKYARTSKGEGGSYNQVTNEIKLCTADMGVFFHELTHAVQKELDGKLKGGQDVEQETIAEFTSCVIASIYGYDKKSNGYQYVKSYNGNDGVKVGEQIIHVISKVEKILNYIFNEVTA